MKGDEVAFAGRSNVGKSSLINALTGRNGLARTSNTPGRTQELIFFAADDRVTLVDMPGYGYAAAPKAKVAAWTALIHAYLARPRQPARGSTCWSMRGAASRRADDEVLKTLDAAAVSYQIVLTKADEVKPAELDACIAATTRGTRQASGRLSGSAGHVGERRCRHPRTARRGGAAAGRTAPIGAPR